MNQELQILFQQPTKYAIDSNGRTVCINLVTRESRDAGYHCIGCGEEMVAALGDKRVHYFRHKAKCACNQETYLHKLGKRILKERFDTQPEFLVKYRVLNICPMLGECKWGRCLPDGWKTIDLKKYYDTCELEITYNEFRADVMLSSKEHPEYNPVFLEVAVQHKCEQVKIDSGIRIIEIDIASEDDVNRKIVESTNVRFYNFKRKITPIGLILSRFALVQDANGVYRGINEQHSVTCLTTDHHVNACFEVTLLTKVVKEKRQYGLWALGMALAMQKGLGVKHCKFCSNYNRCLLEVNTNARDKRTGKTITVSYPNQSLNIDIDKHVQAKGCKYYHANGRLCQAIIKAYNDTPYQEYSS
jgi:hypothetical protein